MSDQLKRLVLGYYGPCMGVDVTSFATAIGIEDISLIEKTFNDLCKCIEANSMDKYENINKYFNRLRTHVILHFSGKDSVRPPNLVYTYFSPYVN